MAIVCGRPKISPVVFLLAIMLVILAIVAIVWTTRRSPQQVVPAPSAQIELPLGSMPLQAHLLGWDEQVISIGFAAGLTVN